MSHASNSHITKVGLWGMPFHGLVQYVGGSAKLALPSETMAAVPATPADYVLAGTLANGSEAYTQEGIQVFVDTFPTIGKRFYLPWDLYDNSQRTAGTCRLWQNPATPEVARSPAEATEDLQRGHTWRNYALFNGNAAQIARASAKRLGGLNWVYLASDGSRWQVALSTPDSAANPKVIRYAFRKFGHFDNDTALSLSTPANFLSIPNGTPALPSLVLSLRLGGVNKTGSQALLISADPVNFSTQPPPGSFIINQDVMNYGPSAFVHLLDVTETLDAGIVTGIVVTATELKNRAACQTGVQTVAADNYATLPNNSGGTYSCLMSRAYRAAWIVSAYFTPDGVVEYVTVTYDNAVTGIAAASYTFPDNSGNITCDTKIPPAWLITDTRTHTESIKFSFGGADFIYSSVLQKDDFNQCVPGAGNNYVESAHNYDEWTTTTPFTSSSSFENTGSYSINKNICSDPVIIPVGPGSVSPIPAAVDYAGLQFYFEQIVSGTPSLASYLLVPLPIVTGEGVSGIVELSKPSTSWQYQYRLLSAYGTEHTLSDAVVTINGALPINDRIPLFASAQPITGDYIYAQATPVCYV